MLITEKFAFFYNGPFSQFYPSSFACTERIYCCAEQYMMFQKALIFGDSSAAERIIQETIPSKIKLLGRTVSNFDEFVWNEHKYRIVFNGNMLKFTQNRDLKSMLLSIKSTYFVEASITDTVWGIGLSISNPNIHDESKWRGQNLLGKAITEVRNKIVEFGL